MDSCIEATELKIDRIQLFKAHLHRRVLVQFLPQLFSRWGCAWKSTVISVLQRGDYTFKTVRRAKLIWSAILDAFPVASSQAGLTRSEV